MARAYSRQTRAKTVYRTPYPRPVRRRFIGTKTAAAATTLNYYTGAMANAKRMTRGLGF